MFKTPQTKLFVMSASLSCLFLSACGGGGGGNSTPPFQFITPTPDANYSGSQSAALLDEDNTTIFAELVLGTSYQDEFLSRAVETEQPVLKNQPSLLNTINSGINAFASTNPSLQAKRVQESEACTHGGSIALDAEVSESGDTGTANFTFNNCEEDRGIVISGQAFQTMRSEYYPQDYTIGYHNLSISDSGQQFVMSGTLDYKQVSGTNATTTQTINLSVTHPSTGNSTYLKDFVFEVLHYSLDSVSGEVYLGTEGYALVESSETFKANSPENIIPTHGMIHFYGAASSTSRARPYPSEVYSEFNKYRLDLDQGGDGSYEYTSVQNINDDNDTPLSSNQPPVPTIEISTRYSDDVIPDDYRYPDEGFATGETLAFSAEAVEDPENDAITYEWILDSWPETSTATLISSTEDTRFASLRTDVAGDYRVILAVSDPDGSQERRSTAVDILVADPVFDGLTSLEDSNFYCNNSCEWDTKTIALGGRVKIGISDYHDVDECEWYLENKEQDSTGVFWSWYQQGDSTTFTTYDSGEISLDVTCKNTQGDSLSYSTTLYASHIL